MNPDNFGWAKEFLSSKALGHLDSKWGTIDFCLPKNCHSEHGIHCMFSSEYGIEKRGLTLEEIHEEGQKTIEGGKQHLVTPKTKKPRKRKAPIVGSQVRRSPGHHQCNSGTKPFGCPRKISCLLPCSTNFES